MRSGNPFCILVSLFQLALFGRIILSWFPIGPGSALAQIFSFLYTITEPILGPIRRALPPMNVGGMGFDLSPIIVLFAINLIIEPLLRC